MTSLLLSLSGSMDLTKYFRRIGFSGSFERPDLATLKQVHKLHVMSIPFENLSIHCGEYCSMDLSKIWDKIVMCGRGGWCLENNLLFGCALREMGFRTTVLGSRVYSAPRRNFSAFEDHLIHKVELDEAVYVVDVSFGGARQLWEPLELTSGKEQRQAAGIFRLVDRGDEWELEQTRRKPEVLDPAFAKSGLVLTDQTGPIYRFTLEPRRYEDFAEVNLKLQMDPSSLFTNKSLILVQTETGFKAVLGWTYSEVEFRPDLDLDLYNMRKIKDDEEMERILMEEFGVRLKNKLQPVDKSLSA